MSRIKKGEMSLSEKVVVLLESSDCDRVDRSELMEFLGVDERELTFAISQAKFRRGMEIERHISYSIVDDSGARPPMALKELRSIIKEPGDWYTVAELENLTGFSYTTVNDALIKLTSAGILKVDRKPGAGSPRIYSVNKEEV